MPAIYCNELKLLAICDPCRASARHEWRYWNGFIGCVLFPAMFMLNWLEAFCGAIDSTNEALGLMVSWVSLLLVLVVFVDVAMRYLFKTSFVFTRELGWHLFAAIFLQGLSFFDKLQLCSGSVALSPQH